MATPVPQPILDTRNGDLVAAQAIGALPPELSDRSNSNPAVVIIEACGFVLDKLLFQLNQWSKTGVIQQCLSLVGIVQNPAVGATVQQTFTLSQPQQQDTIIPVGTLISTADGSITFSTLAALTIKAYTAPAGTISITQGSTTVTGSGTSFPIDGSWNGFQIQIQGGTWYTIASVSTGTSLTLTASAATTASGAFYSGAVTGATSAQCTTTGAVTSVAAGALNTLSSAPAGVSSTSNGAAAAGGADLETVTAAIARAASAFAARDVACSATDYAYFAQQILGQNSRAAALPNTNVTTTQAGVVSAAMLSPAWTTTTPVSASERGAVVRDMVGRQFVGATMVDVAANIVTYTPAAVFFRKGVYAAATAQVAAATALNNYLSPNTYPWNPPLYSGGYRPIDTSDLAGLLEAMPQIDRVLSVNGVVAVATAMNTTANNVSFTNGSTSATCNAADTAAGKITAGQTFVIDPNTGGTTAYLVTAIGGGGTTLTLDHAFGGPTIAALTNYLNSGTTNLTNWYTLPFSNLSVSTSAPPATMVVMGAV